MRVESSSVRVESSRRLGSRNASEMRQKIGPAKKCTTRATRLENQHANKCSVRGTAVPGSKVGPSRCHNPEGIGFFRHVEPAGMVPTLVSQPLCFVSNLSSVLLLPSHRSLLGPTKSRAILRKVSSVRGASAGAKRYA